MMPNISVRDLSEVLGSASVRGMAGIAGSTNLPISIRVLSNSVWLNCLTQHYDNARTGWNSHEYKLTVANVPSLKQLFLPFALEGNVYAQPLYIHRILMSDGAVHNVTIVATEMNRVYAIDADSGSLLWKQQLMPSGESFVLSSDLSAQTLNIRPTIGITSTPVIDRATNTLFAVSKTSRVQSGATSYHQYLYALDIATGSTKPGAPTEITATFTGDASPNDGHGNVIFHPKWHLNRPALLLQEGLIFVAFGSHDDQEPDHWHGWIMSYDANSLAQRSVFCTTPRYSPDSRISPNMGQGANGSIWQSGMGPAADSWNFIYFATGNGPFGVDKNIPNYGDTILKLSAGDLSFDSYFTPGDQYVDLQQDVDLGSCGVVVLPDQPDSPAPRLLVQCGKDGKIFLLNRDDLGGYAGAGSNDPNAWQQLLLQPNVPESAQPGVWGGAAYWNGPNGQFIYFCGDKGPLTAFALQNGKLSAATLPNGQPNQSKMNFPAEGGTTPIVTSNRQVAGTGVVWAIARRDNDGIQLWAFDAADLSNRLVALPAGPWTNPHGNAFIEPTVANGKVYVASEGWLTAFGI